MMEEVKYAIQDDYPNDFAHCFGCGHQNKEGHLFRTGWKGDQSVTVYQPEPKHTAIPGFIYGGLLASLVDCHGTGSAALFLHRKNGHEPGDGVPAPRFVTASLHVDYLKPTPQGIPLKAVGEIEEIHPKKFKVTTNVYANDEVVVKGEVVAAVMPDTFVKKG
ncbi:PaaI family thioesterase [Allobacillus sp. GCM10007491]|uniref:PaaI family thioesterase n=1 Tax=Allobacillus saliphilus TaxID=2912308 RepID=A0A941CWH4_9BACI|nr:PaaI family thioesterase [Allobacillus saliphilus]MBR7553683.1 PaaI family thioesterase [Allobacillus saliphilus]